MQGDFAGDVVQRLLQPIAGAANPCGPDLSQDTTFFELDRAAQGKPETQFSEAVPPDWQEVQQKSEALLERSRDLRVAILWTRASVALEGFAGLAKGLQLVQGLLQDFWDHVHPLPDDGDPYPRMNALAVLPAPEGLLGDLRRTFLLRQRQIGEVRMRDVEVALRMLPPRAGETPIPRDQLALMIRDAVHADPSLREASRAATASLQALAAVVAAHETADSPAPDWKPLQGLIAGVESLMPVDAPALAATAAAAVPAPQEQPAVAALAAFGGVNSRQDALRAIDMVCEYLEHNEPTNPAPLFLRRARRLITHSFLQLVKELAPDALPEIARVVGVNPDTVKLEDAT